MTFAIHGLAVARGIAIGRAVLVASSRVDVAHYFIEADQVESEIARVAAARDAVVEEINRLLHNMPKDAPPDLSTLGGDVADMPAKIAEELRELGLL